MPGPDSLTGSGLVNPFLTPGNGGSDASDAQSDSFPRTSYFSGTPGNGQVTRRKFKSSRLQPGELDEKPWLLEKEPKKKWEKIIFWAGCAIGLVIGAVICFFSYSSVSNFEYCLVLDDSFKTIDESVWNYEIQRGGFGSGSFEWTTKDPKNIYTDQEGLHIVPTLTLNSTDITMDQLLDNYVLNMTLDGTCTAINDADCAIRSNKTAGTIINPVRSARINTKGKKNIKYGKVEVIAKMPAGDWLWPAIWMMPETSAYGQWPASGEIDIAEMRGNNPENYPDGRDSIISALHWGPVPAVDAFWRTSGKHNIRRTDYAAQYHTYGVEWSENYIFTYIDSRLLQVFFTKFNKPMWARGQFGQTILNHSALFDPWSQTGRKNTPFDQDFYLILNVAIGATNGFFKDGVGNKPWGDASLTAPAAFWQAQGNWLPTWGEGPNSGLTIKNVKMWSQGACGSKPAGA